jgi:Mg-chelatase subunit ChlD
MKKARPRRGSVTVLAAVLIVVLLAMVAFAVDCGFIALTRTDLQAAADAGALAGAGELPQSSRSGREAARWFAQKNVEEAEVDVVTGNWDWDQRLFNPGERPTNAVQVSLSQTKTPLFFANVMGRRHFDSSARAIATYRQRDIMLVLDFSGSMNSHDKVGQLKESVDLFFRALDDSGGYDRVGFVAYSTKAELEIGLTHDYRSINRIVQKKKATGWTNIGEGMLHGRIELENNSRPIARKMMVIMTDGHVNRPANGNPRGFVLDQARQAAEANIDLVTISFGKDADKSLMKQVADTVDGPHFLVSGTVKQQEEELRAAFYDIATRRPTVLVQ